MMIISNDIGAPTRNEPVSTTTFDPNTYTNEYYPSGHFRYKYSLDELIIHCLSYNIAVLGIRGTDNIPSVTPRQLEERITILHSAGMSGSRQFPFYTAVLFHDPIDSSAKTSLIADDFILIDFNKLLENHVDKLDNAISLNNKPGKTTTTTLYKHYKYIYIIYKHSI
jgi:hypothetical protein